MSALRKLANPPAASVSLSAEPALALEVNRQCYPAILGTRRLASLKEHFGANSHHFGTPNKHSPPPLNFFNSLIKLFNKFYAFKMPARLC